MRVAEILAHDEGNLLISESSKKNDSSPGCLKDSSRQKIKIELSGGLDVFVVLRKLVQALWFVNGLGVGASERHAHSVCPQQLQQRTSVQSI